MTKATAKRTPNKPSRLGHDPFQEFETGTGNNQPGRTQNIETDRQAIELNINDKIETLRLPSRFTIAEVEEVYEQMSSILEAKPASIKVEAPEIESVDTAALQLLYAFTCHIRISGKDLHWQSHSEKIEEASRILNINISTGNEQ